MTHALLARKTFDSYLDRGIMNIATYVKVIGGCRKVGWVGYEQNTIVKNGKTRYRVIYKRKQYSHIQYSVFGNEMWFRFASPFYTYDDLNGGALKKYIIATYRPDENGDMIEELVYWRPNSKSERNWSADVTSRMTGESCQDYLIKVRRGISVPFKYSFQVVYRDTDLPRISIQLFTIKTILEHFTGNDCGFLEMPKDIGRFLREFTDDRVKTVIQVMKDTLIPSEMHRPTKDHYVFWFMKYAGMTKEVAEKCYENRIQMSLP